MPRWAGSAIGSVLTRTGRGFAWRALVIQILVPRITYSSPSRMARALIP